MGSILPKPPITTPSGALVEVSDLSHLLNMLGIKVTETVYGD